VKIDINAEITGVAMVYTCFNECCPGAFMYRMLAPALPHADSVTGLMAVSI
jgi:hypothetical protein